MKKFHDALKTIYDPKSSGATTLLSADGSTLLTDKEAIFKRWAEHFLSVLNRPSSINEDAIDRLTQIECNVLLHEFPTVMKTRKQAKLQVQMQFLQRFIRPGATYDIESNILWWFFLFYVLVFKIFCAVGALCMFAYF